MSAKRGLVGLLPGVRRAVIARGLGRLEEHRVLAAAGAVTALLVLGLGSATAWSVQQRDAALGSARSAAQRLDGGGVDHQVEQNLITLQGAELKLFQLRNDAGTGAVSAQLSTLESELAGVTGPAASHAHAVAIVQELTVYTGLEATAQSDNRSGLPVGAAYVREASRYLTTYMLADAEDIRTSDQNTVAADDATAAAFPLWLVIGDALLVLWLLGALVALAQFTRRSVNLGVVGALVAVLALAAWSLTGILVARDRLDAVAAPAAAAATGLAQVRFDAENASMDDQLTLSDNGEDCAFTTLNPVDTTQDPSADPYASAYVAKCKYESDAEAQLAPHTGTLTKDLDTAVAAIRDPATVNRLLSVLKESDAWYADERALPTLQNLNTQVQAVLKAGQAPRFDKAFDASLMPYTEPSSQSSGPATAAFTAISELVDSQTTAQWRAYDGAESDASSILDGLVLGAVLLGLLGTVAAAGGIGVRAAEYWSRGPRDLPRYTSAPLVRQRSKG